MPQKHQSEDSRRQQFILKTLLLGMVVLSAVSLLRVIFEAITLGSRSHAVPPAVPPVVLLMITGFIVGLYFQSRRRHFRISAYILVSLLTVAGFYCLYAWGVDLPTGTLVLLMAIVMSSILIGTAFSLVLASIISVGLLLLGYLESNGLTHPSKYWTANPGGTGDALTFIFIIGVISIVSWLSNREIELSLRRARKSELALQDERDLLEERVMERTKELEASQQEKIMQLYRFADFGRISAGLLHDIINPLTAVSLNLEQLSTKKRSDLVTQAVEGIKYIEQFVQAARKQLQNPSEISTFSPEVEIDVIIAALSAKIKAASIKIDTKIDTGIKIHGSKYKFHQLLSNLISNAIDAYDGYPGSKRQVELRVEKKGKGCIITVQDFGRGIPESNLNQIFEPFFTTKPTEKANGIGLFIARRIAEEDFSGEITAASSPDRGTTFTVALPKNA